MIVSWNIYEYITGNVLISDALLHGLVSRVVPDDKLEEEVGIMGINNVAS